MNVTGENERRPLRPLSRRRLALTALAALVLMGVVVVASRGERPDGAATADGQEISSVLGSIVLVLMAVVAAALLVIFVFAFNPGRSGANPHPRTGPKLFGQLIVFTLAVGLAVGAYSIWRRTHPDDAGGAGGRGVPAAKQTGDDKLDGRSETEIDWVPAVIVFGGALVAFTAAGVVILRRRPLPDATPSVAERLATVFDETLEDLRAEQDPRRAVVAAYARMERTLARYGIPRRPAEAPHEYVARLLEELTASRFSVRRLTRLYEVAKFSSHDVAPQMKQQAIDALEAIRDELRAEAAEPLRAAAT